MTIAGFLLLIAGWGIAMTAAALLPRGASANGFVLAGAGVQALGMGIVIRAHSRRRGASE